MRTRPRELRRVALFVVFLVVWQVTCKRDADLRLFFSTPELTARYVYSHLRDLTADSLYTSLESLAGFAIACIVSWTLIFPCFYFRSLLRRILPPVVASQTVPLITLAPLFIVVFGIGFASKALMAALLCFFPLFVSLANAYSSTPRELREMANLYNSPVLTRLRLIELPLALPGVFSGLKVSVTLSVVGAVVAEFNGSSLGLGRDLFVAAKRLDAELMIGSLALTTALGLLLYSGVAAAERRFGFWYVSSNERNEQ